MVLLVVKIKKPITINRKVFFLTSSIFGLLIAKILFYDFTLQIDPKIPISFHLLRISTSLYVTDSKVLTIFDISLIRIILNF